MSTDRQSIAPVFMWAVALGLVSWAFSWLVKDQSTHGDEQQLKAAAAGPTGDAEKAEAVADKA